MPSKRGTLSFMWWRCAGVGGGMGEEDGEWGGTEMEAKRSMRESIFAVSEV